jgi:VWFA-related protein
MVTQEAWTIRKRVNEVTVFFTVRKGNKYVDDITRGEVRVRDDRKPVVKLSSLGHQSDLPLRLGLLIDTSDSVEYRFRFEKEASSRFLQKTVGLNMDRAFVMGFSDEARLAAEYTDDPQQLATGVAGLRSGGGTALYQAVDEACEKLVGKNDDLPVARILVVLSDGDDNSSKITLEQAIESAQRREVTIYSIDTNNSGIFRPSDRVMKRLAEGTGGEMFVPNNAKDMVKAFASVEQEMRSGYAISYQPTDLVEDGRYRRLAERSHKRFHVQARKGYYAPLARPAN